jgi:multiple sugar transport system ATP-binding protein
MTLGDRIVIMKDGFIQQIGTPQEVFNHPYNLFVAGFIGAPQMNFFDAKLLKKDGKYAIDLYGYQVELSEEKQTALTANNVAEQEIVLGVRPEHITVENNEGVDAVIDVHELMGSSVHLHLNTHGKDIIAVVSTMDMSEAEVAALKSGTAVTFDFGGHNCHVFSVETGINLEA